MITATVKERQGYSRVQVRPGDPDGTGLLWGRAQQAFSYCLCHSGWKETRPTLR